MTPLHELNKNGRYWVRGAIAHQVAERLHTLLDSETSPGERLDKTNVKQLLPYIEPVIEKARALLPGCQPVRAITFNKTNETNWGVGWHQDRVIAVENRYQVDGYTNWTRKGGVWNCEPPTEVLEKMIFARIHLDSSKIENGCLEIARSSHLKGRIASCDIAAIAGKLSIEQCIAEKGDVLFGKALLLHRSNPSTSAEPRMVLRIDFANRALPSQLTWAYL